MLWFNYVVSFSDGVQKVGITSQPFYRLQDRLLEAARHGLLIEDFLLSEPLPQKALAVEVKQDVCETFSALAMPGHADWFRFAPVDQGEPTTDEEAQQQIDALLKIPSAMRWAVYHKTPLTFAAKTATQYHDFCKFAEELSCNGAFIRPAVATRLALTLVRPHEEIFAASEACHQLAEGLPKHYAELIWEAYFDQKESVKIERVKAVLA